MAKKTDTHDRVTHVYSDDLSLTRAVNKFEQNYVRPYPRVQKVFTKPSKTRISEMASVDLKSLVQRYSQFHGVSPHKLTLDRAGGQNLPYADLSNVPETRLDLFNHVMALEAHLDDNFKKLPLKLRQAVGHDPNRLQDWIRSNPELAEQLLAEPAEAAMQPALKPSPANPTSSGGAGEGKSGDPA